MKKIIGFIFVLAFCFSALSADFFPFRYEQKILPNGLKVIALPLPNPGLVAFYSIVRTGSRDEYEPGHSGFAHFFEHMMFRGTKNYPGPVYDKIVTEMGANANAFTTDDLTCYYMVFASEHLEKVFELESDRFQNLDYNEQEFKTESGAVYGEYLKSKADPWFIIEETLYDTAFDRHTYKHTTIGFENDIKAMPEMYEYSKKFYQRYYRPENVVLLIAGDIKPEKVFALAEKYYQNWKAGYVAPEVVPEPEQTAPRFKEIKYSGKILPTLVLAYKSLQFDPAAKEYVATILLEDLIFGSTSELYQKLVLQEQKVQLLMANFGQNRDPNLNVIYAMLKKAEYRDYVKAQLEQAIKKFQNEPVSVEKLNALKSNTRYSFLMSLNSTSRVAAVLSRIIAITGGIEAINVYYQTLAAVTPEDILAAAKKAFRDEIKTEIYMEGE